jgi:hypothetical protein
VLQIKELKGRVGTPGPTSNPTSKKTGRQARYQLRLMWSFHKSVNIGHLRHWQQAQIEERQEDEDGIRCTREE